MKRYHIINELISKHGYRSYLEVGVQYCDCFSRIDCEVKRCVDPNHDANYQMTSDDFFAQNIDSYDIIFIDGLHEQWQAYTDVLNALECIPEHGTVVMHDCDPPTELAQEPLCDANQDVWCGDVWKAVARLRSHTGLSVRVFPDDLGCGIITFGEQEEVFYPDEMDWGYFVAHRYDILRPVKELP